MKLGDKMGGGENQINHPKLLGGRMDITVIHPIPAFRLATISKPKLLCRVVGKVKWDNLVHVSGWEDGMQT